jgi:hypothetical protein
MTVTAHDGREASRTEAAASSTDERRTVYATRGLVRALLELASDAEPRKVTVSIAVSPGADLGEEAPDAPVFTHFYFPNASRSTSAVFGIDLSVPPRRTQGRFVSHPTSGLSVSQRDDLHEVVFVATPPWRPEGVAAFDRSGHRYRLVLVDATPPEDVLP